MTATNMGRCLCGNYYQRQMAGWPGRVEWSAYVPMLKDNNA